MDQMAAVIDHLQEIAAFHGPSLPLGETGSAIASGDAQFPQSPVEGCQILIPACHESQAGLPAPCATRRTNFYYGIYVWPDGQRSFSIHTLSGPRLISGMDLAMASLARTAAIVILLRLDARMIYLRTNPLLRSCPDPHTVIPEKA
jgi:hypothetical protein